MNLSKHVVVEIYASVVLLKSKKKFNYKKESYYEHNTKDKRYYIQD